MLASVKDNSGWVIFYFWHQTSHSFGPDTSTRTFLMLQRSSLSSQPIFMFDRAWRWPALAVDVGEGDIGPFLVFFLHNHPPLFPPSLHEPRISLRCPCPIPWPLDLQNAGEDSTELGKSSRASNRVKPYMVPPLDVPSSSIEAFL